MKCNTCGNELGDKYYSLLNLPFKYETVNGYLRLVSGWQEGHACEECAIKYYNKCNGTHVSEMPKGIIWTKNMT